MCVLLSVCCVLYVVLHSLALLCPPLCLYTKRHTTQEQWQQGNSLLLQPIQKKLAATSFTQVLGSVPLNYILLYSIYILYIRHSLELQVWAWLSESDKQPYQMLAQRWDAFSSECADAWL